MPSTLQLQPLDNLLVGASDFKPFAYYDKHLDAIRVQILDCSHWEARLSKFVTVCYASHGFTKAGNDEQIVGFVIKGVSHLLDRFGLPASGAVKLASFLNSLVVEFPSESTKLALETFQSWPSSKPSEVNVEVPAAA